MNLKNNALRSEDIQDMLERPPHWLIRSGTVIILIIFILAIFGSWIIKYPDTVSAKITITTNLPPEKIVSKSSGRIEAIFVKNKQSVTRGLKVAIIENAADHEDVFKLKDVLDSINRTDARFPFHLFNNRKLGEIEGSFSMFMNEYTAFELENKWHPSTINKSEILAEINSLKERLDLLQSQKIIGQSELSLHDNDLKRHLSLFKKGIISEQEYEKQQLTYLKSQQDYKELLGSISELKSSISLLGKNLKINHVDENISKVTLNNRLKLASQALEKAIKDWELKYTLTSGTTGMINFLEIWAPGQTVKEGEAVFVIVPNQENGIIGKAILTASNSGKVAVGQKVHVHLYNYPDSEFGIVSGVIKSISLTPDKNGDLLLDVIFPNNLNTSYGKTLPLRHDMIGYAEIITEDLRLIERFIYQFRTLKEAN